MRFIIFFRCFLSVYTQYLWPISPMQCFYGRVVSGKNKFDGGLWQLLYTELHWLGVSARVAYKLSTVPDGFLPSDLQRRITATSICQPTTPGRSTLPAKHHRPTGFLCGGFVGVEFFSGLLARSCCWSRHI